MVDQSAKSQPKLSNCDGAVMELLGRSYKRIFVSHTHTHRVFIFVGALCISEVPEEELPVFSETIN